MEVTGLIGPSGSGKSHRALFVAHEHEIPLIIDDGLLIKYNHIVAGTSSKRQSTRIGAIKTALFTNKEHAEEVKEKIKEIDPLKILILGTSDKMINKIAANLDLPHVSEIIPIHEIATSEEIEEAYSIRIKEGKHVIPAPTVQVKSRLSGLFIAPLPTLFKKKDSSKHKKHFMVNQTVVQPTFNFYGRFYISSSVVIHIIEIAAKEITGVHKLYNVKLKSTEKGIEVNIYIAAEYGYYLPELARRIKISIQETLEEMTSLHILEMNVHIKKIKGS